MTTQLPAHLLALFNSNPDLAKVGENVINEAFAKIRYNAFKWRLIPLSGVEEVITIATPQGAVNSPSIEVIVVDINEHKSHVVYERSYDDRSDDNQPPVWSSDDGAPVPVEHEGKVVTDYRKVAVIVANNPEGGVYELRVSAGSITNFDRYNTTLKNHGIPIGSMVTRIKFDAAKTEYPKLVFEPAAYLDENQAAGLGKAFENRTTINAILGRNRKTQAALPAPIAQIALPAPVADTVAVEPVKRTRKASPAPVTQTTFATVLPTPSAPTTQAAAVITKPQTTSSDLDALLNNIMGKK